MMALAPLDFIDFCALVWDEVQAADLKHGTWEGEHLHQCAVRVVEESEEVLAAARLNDLHGPHGIKRESVQTAVTAYKMYRRVSP